MPLPPDYTPGPLQVVGPKLFGNTAEFLKEQLSGQIKLPPDLTEQQLEKLEEVAKFGMKSGKGNDPKKSLFFNGKFLQEQEARLLIIQKARAELLRIKSQRR
jgi:hypothetical protein